MKRILLLLLALTLLLGLTACGGNKNDNTLVYGSGDYTSINPIMNEHCEIKHLLFDGLMARDGEGNLIPALAESYTYDAASLTYTFRLRQDVTWHDGEKFTAQDVKFTIDAIRDPDNGSENLPNYQEVKEIKVLGEYEIAFTLSEPNFAFLDYMTMSILPEHCLAGEDLWESDYFKAPIGTGPYKLETWDVGQSINLVRNEDYFGGKANIERVIFKIVTDDAAKALQLKSGELDLAQLAPRDAATFTDQKNFTVYDMQTVSWE